MANSDSNRFSSDLSDIESSWSPPLSVQLSYEAVVTGDELKEVKLGIIKVLKKYGLSGIIDIDNVLARPFVDPSISYLPSQFGYSLLVSSTDQYASQIKSVEACLSHFGLDVGSIISPSRSQFVGYLIRLVFYAILRASRVPVIVCCCGRVNNLMLKLSDGDLDLHLIIDLLLLLPPENILIPVFEGYDCDACSGLGNQFLVMLKQHNRSFILYHAVKLGGPSIFSHLPRELRMPSDLKEVFRRCNDCPTATIEAAQDIQRIDLSSMHAEEPVMPACGCGECSVFDVCANKCRHPHESRVVPVLHIPGDNSFIHNCTRQETHEVVHRVYFLLESACHGLLQNVDHRRLVFIIRNFFPRLKELRSAGEDLSSNINDFMHRFCRHLIDEAAWISQENLDRLKKLVEELGCRDQLNSILSEIESCVDKLTDIQRLEQSSRIICYPSHCHHSRMEHYLFSIDEGFASLPFSAFDSLHHLVLEKICQHKQMHVFVSFATCQSVSLQ